MTDNKIPSAMDLAQNQVFGNQEPFQHIQQQDIINCIQFDPSGQLLAIGDNAGRVILFKEREDQFQEKKSFQYYSEFQSHVPEFDTLKSLTMSESIFHMRWLRSQGKYHKMITSNSNCIKLWKMFQKIETKVILTGQRQNHWHQNHDFAMPLLNKQKSFTSNNQIVFPIKHQGILNQVQVSNNQEYIFSTDEERAIIWSFEKYNSPFVVEDIKSKKNWKEGQKVTCSKLHPNCDNIFTTGSSKGRVELNDLRTGLNGRKNSNFLFEKQQKKDADYFKDMSVRINSLQFLSQGRYVVARDYLTIKIWDICRPSEPLNVLEINQGLRPRMCHLFQNDCIQDSFQISSFSQNLIVTGTYDQKFHLTDPLNNLNVQYRMSFDKSKTKKLYLSQGKTLQSEKFDINKKVLACGVHQPSKKIALASLNSFFIYSPLKQQNENAFR